MKMKKIIGLLLFAFGGAVVFESLFSHSQTELESIVISPNLELDVTRVDVNEFIRKLPIGQHASQAKRDSAAERGFLLKDGQTWVEAHCRDYKHF